MKKKSVEQKFRERLALKQPHLTCPSFLGMSRITKFECKCHGQFSALFDASPKKALVSGCPECADVAQELKCWRDLRIQRLQAIAKERLSGVKIVAKHLTKMLVKVQCSTCEYTWTSDAEALLINMCGCPICAQPEVKVKHHGQSALTGRSKFRTVSYKYNGRIWSFTPHAKNKKSVYFYAESFDLKRMAAIDRVYKKMGLDLCLGLISSNRVLDVENWRSCSDHNQILATVRRQAIKSCTILCMDPGVTNSAWAALKVDRPFKVTVLASGMITNTVTELTGNTLTQIRAFRSEVDALMREFDPQFFIAERYMSRGMGGATIELVNVMLGVLADMWPHDTNTFKLIPSAQWKNPYNAQSSLENFYTKVNCVVHQVDAIAIGIYGAAHWLDEKPFSTIDDLERKLIPQINRTNREKIVCNP